MRPRQTPGQVRTRPARYQIHSRIPSPSRLKHHPMNLQLLEELQRDMEHIRFKSSQRYDPRPATPPLRFARYWSNTRIPVENSVLRSRASGRHQHERSQDPGCEELHLASPSSGFIALTYPKCRRSQRAVGSLPKLP